MANDKKGSSGLYTINLSDEARLAALKTVLNYESAIRGLTVGQTLLQFVMRAVDPDTYPPELIEQIEELKARRAARALERSLQAASLERSA